MDELFYNQSIRGLLTNLDNLSERSGPVELTICWFNDLYLPCQTPPDRQPAEAWERGQQEWKSCFSDRDLQVLEEFHEAFSAEVDGLPIDGDWRGNARWLKVSGAARGALAQLDALASE
jgi:hypothetical protein